MLLDGGFYEGAYYLCGYAVECALKACIAKQTGRHDFPDRRFTGAVYTHNLATLMREAGLTGDLERSVAADPKLGENWLVVKDWNEERRYHGRDEPASRVLVNAVSDRRHGVLPWIRRHY